MVVIHCLVLLSLFVEVLSVFCNAEFSVLPSFAKDSLLKKELIALLLLFSCCRLLFCSLSSSCKSFPT